MKIKVEVLRAFLEKHNLTIEDFAQKSKMGVLEVEKLLNGEEIEIAPARKFIYFLGAYKAQKFVDWKAIDKKNPLANEFFEEGSDDENL